MLPAHAKPGGETHPTQFTDGSLYEGGWSEDVPEAWALGARSKRRDSGFVGLGV